ncbi:MAG: presenilin family intramembrane aspartyl protease [Candidatus Micrarchaeia archaeon]
MKKSTKNATGNERIAAFSRKINLFLMLAAFANTLLISLFIGAGFITQQLTVVDNPADVANSFGLIGYMIFAAALMLLILRFYKGKLLFQLLEYGLIATSAEVFGAVFLPGYDLYIVIAAVAARLLLPRLQTVLLLFSSIVVGAILGASLDFIPVAVFATLLAAYDYIAVFRTKHMVELAKGLSEREAAFSIKIGVSLPAGKGKDETAKPKTTDVAAKAGLAEETRAAAPGKAPAVRNGIELGLGDFLIGVMLSVAALKIGTFPSFGYGLASVIGASAGLTLMFIYLERKGGYFPAVPPIAAGSLLCISLYWCALSLFGIA